MMTPDKAGGPSVVDPSSNMLIRRSEHRPPSRHNSIESVESNDGTGLMQRKLRGLRRNRSGEERLRLSGNNHRNGGGGIRDVVGGMGVVGLSLVKRNASDDSIKYNRNRSRSPSGGSKHSNGSLGVASDESYAVYEKVTPVDKSILNRQNLGSNPPPPAADNDNNFGDATESPLPPQQQQQQQQQQQPPQQRGLGQRGLGRRGAGVMSGSTNLRGSIGDSVQSLTPNPNHPLQVVNSDHTISALSVASSVTGRARTRGLGSTRRQISTARVVEPSGAVPMVSTMGIVAPLSPKNTNRGGTSVSSNIVGSRSSSVATIRGGISTRSAVGGGGAGVRLSSSMIPPVLPAVVDTQPKPQEPTPSTTATPAAAAANNNTTSVQRRSSDLPDQNKAKCFVKWGQQSIMIMMDPDEPLVNFRMQLEEATGIPSAEHRYTWCGSQKAFENDKTLRHYGCQGGGFFYLRRGPPLATNTTANTGNLHPTMMSASNRPIPLPQNYSSSPTASTRGRAGSPVRPESGGGGGAGAEFDANNNSAGTAMNGSHHSPRHQQQQQQQLRRSRLSNIQTMMNVNHNNNDHSSVSNHSSHTHPAVRGRSEVVPDPLNSNNNVPNIINAGSHHSSVTYASTGTSTTTTRSRTPPPPSRQHNNINISNNTPSPSVLPAHVQEAQELAEASLATGGAAATDAAAGAGGGPLYQPTERDWAELYNRHVALLERKDLEIAMKLSQQRRASIPGTAEQGGALLRDVDAAAAAAAAAASAAGGSSETDNGIELAMEVSRREATDHENKEEEMLALVLEMSRNDEGFGNSHDNASFGHDSGGMGNGEGTTSTTNANVGGNVIPPYPSQQAKGPDDDVDAELRRALQLSAQQQQPSQQAALSEEEELERILKLSQQEAQQAQQQAQQQAAVDEDEELRRVLEMSQQEHHQHYQQGARRDPNNEEEELRRILELSQQEATDVDKERETMELVMKLSQMGEL